MKKRKKEERRRKEEKRNLSKKLKRHTNNNTLVKHWFPLSFYCLVLQCNLVPFPRNECQPALSQGFRGLSTIEFDIPNVDSTGSDYFIISIFGYYFGDVWGLKGIYTIFVVLYVMSTAQLSCIMWSVQWYIYVHLFWMSYPHLRFVEEGPFQRAVLCLCGSTLLWCC